MRVSQIMFVRMWKFHWKKTTTKTWKIIEFIILKLLNASKLPVYLNKLKHDALDSDNFFHWPITSKNSNDCSHSSKQVRGVNFLGDFMKNSKTLKLWKTTQIIVYDVPQFRAQKKAAWVVPMFALLLAIRIKDQLWPLWSKTVMRVWYQKAGDNFDAECLINCCIKHDSWSIC